MDEQFSELTREEQRASEIRDMARQKALDASWGIEQEPMGPALLELNKRLVQYGVFVGYSTDFKVAQAIQDFNRLVIPIFDRTKKLPPEEDAPLAIDRATGKAIILRRTTWLFDFKE